ncbi:MarR family winged helix-turn-helix transcriptional regulator [Kitasatospora sp. NPDC058032]|uniref:MarR family winged helix-turn-helix transcriptional regulator n=1 Tax=Kitasatospora sp. NPDC058032 TaxID=3346307 RepID=UPI0036DE1990
MYERGKGSQPSDHVIHLLATAARAADGLLTDLLADRGLSRLHQQVLQTLAEHGPHARPDLAAQVGATPEETSGVVDDLLDKTLVTSMVVHAGGRQELVLLAPPGQAALDHLQTDTGHVEAVLLTSLTKGERSQLGYLLRRVCATAPARGRRKAVPGG